MEMKKLIDSMKGFYHNKKLHTKFAVTHLFITTVPMAFLSFFFHGKLYDMVLADTLRREQSASAMIIPQINSLTNQIIDIQKQLDGHPFYRQFSGSHERGTYDLDFYSPQADLFQNFAEDMVDGKFISNIRIYIDLPETFPALSDEPVNKLFQPLKEAKGTYWHGIFQGDRSLNSLFCPTFYLSPTEARQLGDMAYISRKTFYFDNVSHDCYTAIYFYRFPFDDILKNNLTADTKVAYIINARDSTVAASDDKLSGIYHFSYEQVHDFFMSSNSLIVKQSISQNVYAAFYPIGKADWFMVAVIPVKAITHKSFLILLGFFFIYLLCILVAFLIANRLSRSITNRISSVISQMASVRTEPPSAIETSRYNDEIGNLIDTYNYMVQSMNRLMEQKKQAAEELRIQEFHSLQAQINPHFLYNTMDMINWLARGGQNEKVSDAIVNLSRFYKLTLSRKQSISTLSDELEHIKIYIRLQNMRYHDIIYLICDLPDFMMDCPIPKLTLQPIVENSILHGLLEKTPKGGTIVITGWTDRDDAVILISDDGVGMDSQTLDQILTGTGTSKSGTNIAVFNTHRRLQILYGEQYGLVYRSSSGKGTEVEIHVKG